ncbi:beta-lactamase family protein [bacterium]|nr:beta-lactamase family protein [bacterium]
MKKLLITFLAVLMVLFSTSCGGNSSDKKNDEPADNKNDSDTTDEKNDSDEETKDDTGDTETDDDGTTAPEPTVLTEEEKLESIKNLAEEYINFAHGTGVVVGYGIDKLTSFALGVSSIGTSEPLKTDHLFEIGSITKSFTAVTILLLQEEGKISIDDKISKWFPDFEKGDKITVKMLLNHTSGIKEMTEILDPDKVIENIKGRFNFEPGTAWADTNSDYILAGLIIEKVTGKQAHEVIREKILDPFKLKNTFMKGYEEYPKNSEAKGHNFNNDGKIIPYELDRKAWTAGGMVSNAADLFKYADDLFGGKILKEESLELMLAPVDEKTPYGLGVQLSTGTHGVFYTLAGNASAAKNIAQSHSLLAYYPSDRTKHIILNNFPDNKDIVVLNDEMEWVLINNIFVKERKNSPDWDTLIDGGKNTQIFALSSLYVPGIDYGIGYFAYPEDTYRNYYCKQYVNAQMKQKTDEDDKDEIEKIIIIHDCQEPKEYVNIMTEYKMQRTNIYIDFEDFKNAIESKKPISKFTVEKGNYSIENLTIKSGCYTFEDDGNEDNKTITILKDETIPGAQLYRLWGKASLTKSTKGCYCFEKNEAGELEQVECK